MISKSLFVLLGLAMVSASCGKTTKKPPAEQPEKPPIVLVQPKDTVLNSDTYRVFAIDPQRIKFTAQRPSKKDTTIGLCVAAAFTTLSDYKVSGLYMIGGKVYNQDKINTSVGGAFCKNSMGVQLIDTKKGRYFTEQVVNALKTDSSSVFQQIMIINKGQVPAFKSDIEFQRRAITTNKAGDINLIENTQPKSLKAFCEDLLHIDSTIVQALYLDMGGWDEGWYRYTKDSIVTLGKSRASTHLQTNWLVLTQHRG